MDPTSRLLHQIHARYAPVDARVAEILDHIRSDCKDLETMGADFIRVLIPFGDYDSLNDLLEEAAHLHGIKYNNFLAGGTTDHVSFLEVNNGLWARAADGLRRLASRISGRPYVPPRD